MKRVVITSVDRYEREARTAEMRTGPFRIKKPADSYVLLKKKKYPLLCKESSTVFKRGGSKAPAASDATLGPARATLRDWGKTPAHREPLGNQSGF